MMIILPAPPWLHCRRLHNYCWVSDTHKQQALHTHTHTHTHTHIHNSPVTTQELKKHLCALRPPADIRCEKWLQLLNLTPNRNRADVSLRPAFPEYQAKKGISFRDRSRDHSGQSTPQTRVYDYHSLNPRIDYFVPASAALQSWWHIWLSSYCSAASRGPSMSVSMTSAPRKACTLQL